MGLCCRALPGIRPWTNKASHLVSKARGRGNSLLFRTTGCSDRRPARPQKPKPEIFQDRISTSFLKDHISTSFPKVPAFLFSASHFSSPFPVAKSLSPPLQHQNRWEKKGKTRSQLSPCFNETRLLRASTSPSKPKEKNTQKAPRFPPGPPLHSPMGSVTPFSPSLSSWIFAGAFLALGACRRRRQGRVGSSAAVPLASPLSPALCSHLLPPLPLSLPLGAWF